MWNIIIYLFYTIPNSRWLEINTRTNDISVMAEIKEWGVLIFLGWLKLKYVQIGITKYTCMSIK